MTISAIADVSPFQVTSTSQPFPAELAPNDTFDATVKYAPTGPGSTPNTQLMITRSPALGDDALCASGICTAADISFTLNTNNLLFPSTEVGTATADLPILEFDVIHSTGTAFTVDLTPTGNTQAFEIISPTQFTLNPGDTRTVQIRFLAPPPRQLPDADCGRCL